MKAHNTHYATFAQPLLLSGWKVVVDPWNNYIERNLVISDGKPSFVATSSPTLWETKEAAKEAASKFVVGDFFVEEVCLV